MTEAAHVDEATLVRQATRDRAAFGLLYDRYVNQVYRYAYRRTSQHAEAEDTTAETFRRALEGIGRYEPRGSPFGSWLFAIAANVLRERARRFGGFEETPDHRDGWPDATEPVDGELAVIDRLVRDEEATALWRMVEDLPTDLRRVMVLRYAWDLSYAEIAVRFGRSEAACKQLAYRALKRLRERADCLGELIPPGSRQEFPPS